MAYSLATSLSTEATWEGAEMKQQFRTIHLEDKVLRKAGGIVRPPIVKTYARRANKENG